MEMDYSPSVSSNLSQYDSAAPKLFSKSSSTSSTSSTFSASSTGSLAAPHGLPIRYTPVTGRISRARKGVPVHTCDVCRPVKTFTRAEHLRRHQLSHQKPAYPCTFEDCDRAFHRPDLLAHHLYRHEKQGEKAYNSGDCRSRASSSSPQRIIGESSMTPCLKVETPSSFQAINFSRGALGSNKTSASQADLPGAGTSVLAGSFEHMSFAVTENGTKQAMVNWPYADTQIKSEVGFGSYNEGGFSSYNLTPQLPLLRIPEESYVPGLSYSNESSSWSSDASGSTFSSTRSDGPRVGIARAPSLHPEARINMPSWHAEFESQSSNWLSESKFEDRCSSSVEQVFNQHANGIEDSLQPVDLTYALAADDSRHDTPCISKLKPVVQGRKEVMKIQNLMSMEQSDSKGQSNGAEGQKEQDQVNDDDGTHSTGPHESRQTGDSLSGGSLSEVPEIKIESPSSGSSLCKKHELLATTPPVNRESSPPGKWSPISTRTIWRESSDDFETDSGFSEEETDWEEGDMSSDPDIIALACRHFNVDCTGSSERNLDSIINPVRDSLIERIMGEFWTVFNQEWSANIRRRTESPSTPSSSVSGPKSQQSAQNSNKKHKRTTYSDQDRLPDDDNENEGPKRPRRSAPLPEDANECQHKFSCPYRKHRPRIYNHLDRRWRSCALTPFSTIARVKGHLYRHHRIFQCRRCSKLFKDEDALQSHFMAIDPCGLQESVAAEGITPALEKQLRSRKKTSKAQTEDERWQEIYRILFPMEIVPSSAFEPVQDEAIQSPASFELSNYEEYSRHELPRVFRSALETVINNAAQPLEEQVRSQLVSMIQECQDLVFSTYRNLNSSSPGLSGIEGDPSISSVPIPSSSIPGGLQNPNRLLEEGRESILENLYQRPPYQSQTLSNPDIQLLVQQQAPKSARQNESSESGYVSDFSAPNAPGILNNNPSTDLTTASRSGVGSQSQPNSEYAETYDSSTQPSMSYNENYVRGTFSLDDEAATLPFSEDLSDMYMYENRSWGIPFPQ